MSKTRVTRRNFLKIAGAGGVGSVLSCSAKPARTLIPYIVPPEGAVPGVPAWYATVCRECPAGCGLLVKTREGRAIKAEGNPSHPVNQGKLCLRGQASLQGLYNPMRIMGPMLKDSTGKFQPISWDKALRVLTEKIAGLKKRGQAAFLTPLITGSLDGLVDSWTRVLGIRRIVYEPLAHEQLREANRIAFGRNAIPVYDLEKAKFVLNLGADFLGTWISPVFYARAFGRMRRVTEGTMARVAHVGPRLSLTAANADEWINIRPGAESDFILGIIHVILKERLSVRGGAGLPQKLRSLAEAENPAAVASKTGVRTQDVVRLARTLVRTKPSLVLAGGPAVASRTGTHTAVLVNVLNALCGNIGETVLFGQEESIGRANPYSDTLALIEDMSRGTVPLLFLYNVNPAYTVPAQAGFAEAAKKVGFIVSFSTIRDETTDHAHLLLPDHHFLESWGSYSPRTGVHGLLQPVMDPVSQSRSLGDVLLAAAQAAGKSTAKALPRKTYEDFVKDEWRTHWRNSYRPGKFEDFWASCLSQGGHFVRPSPPAGEGGVRGTPKLLPAAIDGLFVEGHTGGDGFDGAKDGLYLLPSPSVRHYDGRSYDRPWLQEIPDPITTIAWDSWADIHPDRAKALGLSTGDEVMISSPFGTVRSVVNVSTLVGPDVLSLPMGLKPGGNPLALLPRDPDGLSGGPLLFSTRVTVAKTGKRTRLIFTAGTTEDKGRGIARTVSLSELSRQQGGSEENYWGFYPEHEHPEHRWGMVIDLAACIGCGACVAACYAENNLAVVGRENMVLGREMSWIRIERFEIPGKEIGGGVPGIVFVPMLCQHCDRAPCEYVCPVFATYHNPEGLNAQVYNRCVGTRYCSHNCPYKVRRFNWFTFTRPEPLELQYNPDVTVREKGVMEKCTFCIQRIREGKDGAKDEGRRVRDGEIVPACAQTCPTGAIVFGDLKDPGSLVSRLSRDPRRYHVLGDLNTAPAITYLKRVINA